MRAAGVEDFGGGDAVLSAGRVGFGKDESIRRARGGKGPDFGGRLLN